MRRRDVITLLGGAAAAWPLAARAQQLDRPRRVGVVMGYPESDPAAQAQVVAFRRELHRLGWEEGRNVQIEVRFPAADVDRVRAILAELTNLRPDVLVSNTNLVTEVLRKEVHTTPIIFIYVGDPVGSGFVRTDARPDSNLTGFANWELPRDERQMAGAAQRERARSRTCRVHDASRECSACCVLQIC